MSGEVESLEAVFEDLLLAYRCAEQAVISEFETASFEDAHRELEAECVRFRERFKAALGVVAE